ncbi:unnamed protein product [Sphenostylis stenocarpa]|uniref:NAC domain-containing protein n=1 Tax=Sphenostylis stenocarpa TaxID=92480 RepID=A0AA86VU90_9FABA|nr:unnamed protein product [Sphenostylis stenocarpa]
MSFCLLYRNPKQTPSTPSSLTLISRVPVFVCLSHFLPLDLLRPQGKGIEALKINGRKIELEIIPEVDLYKCEPWDLPGKSLLPGKDLEWYFFSPRDRKYPNGSRTNRATKSGYWKATGKDRKVNSKARAVGMKKTLVYYRGRAPHGSRTNWVMHEYRLDETQCETASSLQFQDAYALCRVFKKTTVIPPKVGGHYVSVPNANQISSDQSSSIELYSEGRDEDLDSPNYFMSTDTCSPQNVGSDTPLTINGVTTRGHEKWSHFSSQDPLFSLPTSSYPNFGAIAYPPSKVDIALECARMQHRFVMPPLQVDDFPDVGISELKMTQASSSIQGSRTETDILQEFLSVAHASKELINQSCYSQEWGGNDYYAPSEADFTFMVGTNYNHSNEMSSVSYVDKAWEDSNTRTIEIEDVEEEFKAQRMAENLRWVGMSRQDLEKREDQKIVPIEDISSFQSNREENEVQETEQYSDMKHNDSEINDFSLGFINDSDPSKNYEDGNVDDYSSSPSFEVVEEIKVNHGMLVSTRQVAETFFHQIVPSQTVQVQLNSVTANNHYVENAETMLMITEKQGSLLRKVKAYVMGKLVRPTKTIASAIVIVFALVLTHCVYLMVEVEIWNETCCSSSATVIIS